MSARTNDSVTLEIGETASEIIELGHKTLGHIVVPDELTGTEVALHGSFDRVTFWPMYKDDGTAITYPKPSPAPGGYPVDATYTYAVPFVRFVSDATQADDDAVFLWGVASI